MTVAGSKLLVAETETKIVAVTLSDGKLVWEAPFAAQRMGYNAATPIVDGQTLIYCGSGRGATAVKLEKSGDAFAAKELWKNPDNSVQFNTPVLKNGFLYGLTAGNDLFCLSAQDGKTAWTAPLSPPAAAEATAEAQPEGGRKRGGRGGGGRGGFGSVVDAGSVLFALTPASELIAFQPGEKAYAELARLKVAGSATHAHPVVSGDRIFIKDQDSVTLWTIQ
jgi:outer membrane protein assembly factor BamB